MRTFTLSLMAGIYIHIPFCSKACHYCNFHFSTSLHRKNEVLNALQAELSALAFPTEQSIEKQVDTIYFGGGTPTLLLQAELDGLLDLIHRQFDVSQDAEITIEANPDDLGRQKIGQLLTSGFNRLSIGVQSFDNNDLLWMNRAHDALQAEAAIKMAQDAGLQNISIDLIYGVPTLSDNAWEKNLLTAINLEVPHLSCYALTVEERTALHHFIQKGKVPPLNDAQQVSHFNLMIRLLAISGYEHYEISNFAKAGKRSRHNSSYWQGKPYYGFGPSAHSFDGYNTRWWNVANNALYISALQGGATAYESEKISSTQRINEIIMTSLRTLEGLPLNVVQKRIKGNVIEPLQWQVFLEAINQFMNKNWLTWNDDHLILTDDGKLYADHVAASLFLDETP
jgi:oxygen-independent coproporphyrinogen-3 oxidase